VTQPIKYAKHKNNRRAWLTIALVWVISAAIGSPIVLGLNNTPNRRQDLCLFYNSDFIIYSSLSSFYIPCIIMVFLYYNIFNVSTSPHLLRTVCCLLGVRLLTHPSCGEVLS
jgi:dopamine D2-like receptor